MQKKTTATTVLTILYLFFIVAIGATLSAFKISKEKVEVEKIIINAVEGITITNNKNVKVTELEVKSSAVGVRPATGEEDSETSIPTTVNDAVGTEGSYASFKLSSSADYLIKLKNCYLSNGDVENLENVRVAIMEEENDPVNGANIGAVLAKGNAVANKEMVVVVWLDKDTTKSIKGAKISIELEVVLK